MFPKTKKFTSIKIELPSRFKTSRNVQPEIAHAELRHGAEAHDGEVIERNVRELEAEAVSYIACAVLGIQNERSKYYIAGWNRNATEALELRAGRILSAAEKIVRRCLPRASLSLT